MKTKYVFPNLVIAGAPKCGTSSLYFWLAQHPETCASTLKETFFLADEISRFNENSSYLKDGLEAYKKHFASYKGEKIVFEATAPYIYYNTPLVVLPQLNPQLKVVFILREPAKRLYSLYSFNKFKLKNFSGSFLEYCSLGGEKFSGAHLENGKYAQYISKWKTAFGEENILVLTLEEISKDQKGAMQKLTNWLQIDPSFYNDFDFYKRNETFGVRSTKIHRWLLKLQPLVPYKLQEMLLPFYQKVNAIEIPKISEEEKRLVEDLKDFYKPYNDQLAQLLPSANFTLW